MVHTWLEWLHLAHDATNTRTAAHMHMSPDERPPLRAQKDVATESCPSPLSCNPREFARGLAAFLSKSKKTKKKKKERTDGSVAQETFDISCSQETPVTAGSVRNARRTCAPPSTPLWSFSILLSDSFVHVQPYSVGQQQRGTQSHQLETWWEYTCQTHRGWGKRHTYSPWPTLPSRYLFVENTRRSAEMC